MRGRYDYRNDYKGKNLSQLEIMKNKLKDDLLRWIAIDSKWDIDNCIKRISYLENKMKKTN